MIILFLLIQSFICSRKNFKFHFNIVQASKSNTLFFMRSYPFSTKNESSQNEFLGIKFVSITANEIIFIEGRLSFIVMNQN
jgi:hypothetical protein